MKTHWLFDLDIVATIVAAAAFAFCGWLMGGEFVAALVGLAAISITGAGLARKARRDEAKRAGGRRDARLDFTLYQETSQSNCVIARLDPATQLDARGERARRLADRVAFSSIS